MVLTLDTTNKIKEFIYIKPRTVQEIAQFIKKSWRTTNSYVERIAQETGEVSIRTLREGTRGAVKIVYWNNIEKIHHTQAQERLYKQIELGKNKTEFSPFDIYQYVDKNKRNSFFEEQEDNALTVKHDLKGTLLKSQKRLLIFSGDFSWANLTQEGKSFLDIFEDLARNDITIKILARVDVNSYKNIQKIYDLNAKIGKERIEIRHCEQPLRAFIIDNKLAKFKEIRDYEDYYKNSQSKTYIFYEIYDEHWIEWLEKVFWNLFRISISAKQRFEDLKTIKGIE